MTRARAKEIHEKVNLILNTLDLEHTMYGSLPHCNVICAVRYEPHGASTKDEEHEEEAWKHCKKKAAQNTDRLKPACPSQRRFGLEATYVFLLPKLPKFPQAWLPIYIGYFPLSRIRQELR
jgi:hypothetical protein